MRHFSLTCVCQQTICLPLVCMLALQKYSLEGPVTCSSGNEVLLLLRNSKHNNNTWGLPGGNVEDEDTNLLVTAKREAQEEMGSVPEAAFQNQVLTK